MNNCYYKLNLKLSEDNPLLKDFKDMDYHYANVPKFYGRDETNQDVKPTATFKRAVVPRSYFENDPVIELIELFNLDIKIFLVESEHIYNWHRDVYRYAAFNMMLGGDEDYLVMFSHGYPEKRFPTLTYKDYAYFPYTRLIYEPRNFYLFNGQIPHMVVNHGKTNRYLLTMAEFVNEPVEGTSTGIPDFSYLDNTLDKLKKHNFYK